MLYDNIALKSVPRCVPTGTAFLMLTAAMCLYFIFTSVNTRAEFVHFLFFQFILLLTHNTKF